MGSYNGRPPRVVIYAAGSSGSGSIPPGKVGTPLTFGDVDSSAPTLGRPTPSVPPPEQDPLIGCEIKRSCVIKRRIGVGGMGTVYLAEQTGLKRPVAVKIISAQLAQDVEALQRFHREAQSLARLSHPNIVTIHEFGIKEDEPCKNHPFFVMEYVDGESLEEVITQHPAGLTLETAASYIRSILAALQEAHNLGIVHRDLKPGNVLLKPLASGGYIPKVCDFGLAKEMFGSSGNQTLEGAVRGTPGYMAPEQLRGQEVDHRTDLFAVGVLFFEMLTGKNPFGVAEGAPFADLIAEYLTRDPIPLREFRPDVPDEVNLLIHAALRKNREERIQSAHEMVAWLDRIVELAGAVPLATPKRATPVPEAPEDSVARRSDRRVNIGVALVVAVVAVGAVLLYTETRSVFDGDPQRVRPSRVETAPAPATVAPSRILNPAVRPPASAPAKSGVDPLAELRSRCLAGVAHGVVREPVARAAGARYVHQAPRTERTRAAIELALRRPRTRRAAPTPAPSKVIVLPPEEEPEAEAPAPEPE